MTGPPGGVELEVVVRAGSSRVRALELARLAARLG